jgi:hypothetical protein
MTKKRLLLAACMALTATGCKLDIMVPPGGMVESASGARDCDAALEGKYCTFDLSTVTLPFSETFTASAKPGYQFLQWKKADGFKCGGSTSPTCTLEIEDSEYARAALAGFKTLYLMPEFEYLGIDTDGDGILDPHDTDDDDDGRDDTEDNCPLTWPDEDGFGCPNPLPDSNIVDGKEWAQPIDFLNLSWEDVHEVCPPIHGLPLCRGQLNGVDLRGWRWATSAEVEPFIRSYGGGCSNLGDVFTFVTTFEFGPIISGWVSDTSTHKFLTTGDQQQFGCFMGLVSAQLESASTGSWFYRLVQ